MPGDQGMRTWFDSAKIENGFDGLPKHFIAVFNQDYFDVKR
jgi:hypothetical protein